MKDTIIEIVTILIICMFVVGLGIICVTCRHQKSEEEYNNGYCPCGGHYEYVESVGHRYNTTYIYSCDKCGHKIEISYLQD